ncbi:restriction endonuclease subunit S [Parasediminibacterium paludis]|uniref:Restriction endonuclease subunit S n=1 Tax=Parasediminibacterium paludis TaxID=908966 RepID=A0ABV8PW79_9BACT
MAKETSSTIFKNLVSSPIGLIAEFIVSKHADKYGYEPLRKYFLEIQTGKTPPMSNSDYYSSNDIEWIKPSDIGFEKYITASDWVSNKAEKENKATIYKPNTILIICIGGGIGRLGIVDKKCSSNQQITGILFKENVLPEFAYYFFLSRYKIFEENSSKSTLPIINQKGLGNLDFTCPDIKVQIETVRYLDYCKQCLDTLTYPTDFNFYLTNDILEFSNKAFKAYYTQKTLLFEYKSQLTQIENLNQAILQEAVQGKLVPQNPTDEPATELLQRIKAEKEKLGKKEKPLPPIKPEEIPFDIPKSWVWCNFGVLAELLNGDRGKNYPNREEYVKDGIPWINTGHIEADGTLTTEEMYFITEDKYNSLRGGKIQKDDLVYCLRGATFGKVAFVKPYIKGAIASSLMIIRLSELVEKRYIYYYLKSKLAYNQLRRFNNGSAQPNLAANDVRFYYFPLPPLSEQKRIVAEMEQQLAKTKQLKAHIIANQQATEQLLKALLHQAFEVGERRKRN